MPEVIDNTRIFKKADFKPSVSVNKLAELLSIHPRDFNESSENIQKKIAPILRKIAVKHLGSAQTPKAKQFRGEHLAATNIPYKKYLEKQKINGTWGTDLEAIALGEYLKYNVVVTSVNSARADCTWCLHLEGLNAPTIHLYNDNNQHWQTEPENFVLKDNNCLYNAIALNIKNLISPIKPTSNLSSQSLFKTNDRQKLAIQNQVLIQSAINKATHDKRSPADLANYYEKEEQRIKKLSSDEQNQILNDYYFAINLAMQEIDDKTTESFNIETNTSRFNFPI